WSTWGGRRSRTTPRRSGTCSRCSSSRTRPRPSGRPDGASTVGVAARRQIEVLAFEHHVNLAEDDASRALLDPSRDVRAQAVFSREAHYLRPGPAGAVDRKPAAHVEG